MSSENENKALIDEIIELLNNPDFESPEVILLLGSSGAGKSSLVDTLYGVLTGRYYAIAKQGSGETQSVTLDLLRYENCGVKLHRITDKNKRRKMSAVLSKLPHILDCAGLGDENTPEMREIIELLVGGYIRPGTCMDAVVQEQTRRGTGKMKEMFKPQPAWKVSKIVFLQGCIDVIPGNMIQGLNEVLMMYDPVTLVRKYPCQVFVLVTKYDLVKESDVHSVSTSEGRFINNEKFEQKKQEIAKAFCSVGSTKYNMLPWINLTDDVEFTESTIPTKALKFLKKMVEPGTPKMPAPTFREKLEDFVYKMYYEIRRESLHQIHQHNVSLVQIVGFFMVVFLGIIWLLRRDPEK